MGASFVPVSGLAAQLKEKIELIRGLHMGGQGIEEATVLRLSDELRRLSEPPVQRAIARFNQQRQPVTISNWLVTVANGAGGVVVVLNDLIDRRNRELIDRPIFDSRFRPDWLNDLVGLVSEETGLPPEMENQRLAYFWVMINRRLYTS